MKKSMLILLLIAVVAGCKMKEGKENLPEEKGIPVTVAIVMKTTGENTLNYSGSVEASQTIPLYFQTTGTVEKVLVETGDAVKKGDLLAVLDQSDLKNILAMSESKLAQAQDAYNRLKKVHDQGSLPEIKWVEMETDLSQAKSSVEIARNNLDKCTMRAPSDGVIGRRNIEPGMLSLTPGNPPFELVDITTVNVKISVPENEVNRIRKGMKTTISVAALGGMISEGPVTNISPVAELMSRTYTVRISVNNSRMEMKPGMVCDVRISSGEETPVLVVPYQSVGKESDGKNFVFLVNPDGKTVKKQPVTVGRYVGSGIEITGGLAEGQQVVVRGIEKLSDNSLIQR